MTALVEMTQFGARTSSRTVAEVFEKQHKDVLRAIDSIIEKRGNLIGRNFTPNVVKVKGGPVERTVRSFDMDRDGFALVAFGFTGEKALDWKLAFIEAFNAMEAALTAEEKSAALVAAPQAGIDDPEMIEDLPFIVRLSAVREARQLFGRKRAQALWHQYGLPDGRTGVAALAAPPDSVQQWLAQYTNRAAGHHVLSRDLYASYCEFCELTGGSPVNLTVFGRALTALGHPPRHNSAGRIERGGLTLAA